MILIYYVYRFATVQFKNMLTVRCFVLFLFCFCALILNLNSLPVVRGGMRSPYGKAYNIYDPMWLNFFDLTAHGWLSALETRALLLPDGSRRVYLSCASYRACPGLTVGQAQGKPVWGNTIKKGYFR